jgi:hypothetical protein
MRLQGGVQAGTARKERGSCLTTSMSTRLILLLGTRGGGRGRSQPQWEGQATPGDDTLAFIGAAGCCY